MIERFQLQLFSNRIAEERKFIQVIMGPRQVGKTTMVHQFLNKTTIPHHFISAEGIRDLSSTWIEQQWETARIQQKQNSDREFLLLIDEIQKISNWSEMVKLLWDEDTRFNTPIKVVILGSSSLLIQKGLSESMAGRYEIIQMPHWNYIEMKNSFGFTPEQYAWFGSYPGSADLISDEERWKNYITNSLIEASISKDVLMMTTIYKPVLLRDLFEVGCQYSGQILSFTKIVGQLIDAGNTTTLAHYLHLLDTAGLLGGLEKYFTGKIRQRSSSPKFQVFNNALFSAQRIETFEEVISNPALWGRIVESAIGTHLLSYSKSENFKLFYWRQSGLEVDYVLAKGDQVIGMEVKTGHLKSNSGMDAFKKSFPSAKLILVGKNGIPWQEFLEINPGLLFDYHGH